MTTALVTGHKGFIGSHLYDRLLDDGWMVDGMDLKNDRDCTKIGDYPITDPNVIFHCAANASIPDSLEDPLGTNQNNVGATIQVLEMARKYKCPVIYSSSSSIYGDVQTPYSLQKSIGEQYLKLYWELYKVPSVSLRYFNVYGEGQPDSGAYKLALGIFLKQYKEGKPFTIVGSGEQRRDFVHVDDVVRANLEAYENVKGYECYDVGVGTNYSVNEVCDMIDPKHPRVKLPPRIEPFENKAITAYEKEKDKLKTWIKSQLR